MKTPVTKASLKTHFTYSWWKYLLVLVLVIFGTDLIYTMTAYRSPAEKRVELYVYGYANTEALDAWMEEVRTKEMPDMEVMSSVMLTEDETYGDMQLTTYMYCGEGDLYILPKAKFISCAESGFFVPLEEQTEALSYIEGGAESLVSAWRTNADEGAKHLYGIPLSKLPGMSQFVWAEDGYLSVLVTNGNDANVLKFLEILCRDQSVAPAPETTDTGATEKPAEEAQIPAA